MAMKGYTTFPKAPRLEPHHQMQFNVISKTLLRKRLTPLQRCSQSIPQPQSTGPSINGTLTSINTLDQSGSVREYFTLPRSQERAADPQMQFNVIPGTSLFCKWGGSYSSAEDTVNVLSVPTTEWPGEILQILDKEFGWKHLPTKLLIQDLSEIIRRLQVQSQQQVRLTRNTYYNLTLVLEHG